MSAASTQLRPGEKRDRVLGTAVMVATALLFASQFIPATHHMLHFSAVAAPAWWALGYGGWRLRNSYGTDAAEAPQFRTPQTRRRLGAIYMLIGVAGLIASLFIR